MELNIDNASKLNKGIYKETNNEDQKELFESLKAPTADVSSNNKSVATTRCHKKWSLLEYLRAELIRGYSLELDEERLSARREKVYTFIKVPKEVELLMGYGFFQCSDAFLFVFTFLPLRCLFAIYNFFLKTISSLLKKSLTISSLKSSLKPADKCDLLKLFILITCVYFFSFIDTSVIYHLIKSQSVIKLYIFFNMLEVGDRLFASFVQDTLDALFLTATEVSEKKSRMGTVAHTLLAVISIFGHAVVILLQGTTLSVAINANNRALLTVMMSNNFVELKGAVFKKFDKINLFQISCSDVRERFHLSVLLLIVSIQTMREYSWEESRFWILFPDCLMVMLAEIGVDWLKHAFIIRFNEIPLEVYKEYTLSMAYDLVQTKQRRAFSDHSDMVGRRLGFVPLPLAVVLARVIRPSLKGITYSSIVLILIAYLSLATFRLLNSIVLLGKACDLIDQHGAKTSPSHSSSLKTDSDHHSQSAKEINISPHDPLSRFRSSSSQPTTRTPSPSRLPPDSKFSPSVPLTFPTHRVKYRKNNALFTSKSVSGTPRPSIVNESTENITSLPHESTSLLLANSSVSILSVSLNEEMLRANGSNANSTLENNEERKNLHARKHSLGSNVENEFSFTDRRDNLISLGTQTDEIDDRDLRGEKFMTGGDGENSDLDETLRFSIGEDDLENKENLQSSGAEDKCSESEESGKKKKKGLSWLLHH